MELLCILTLSKPGRDGIVSSSLTTVHTPPPGSTRYDLLQSLRTALEHRDPRVANGSVVHFSAEPNRL